MRVEVVYARPEHQWLIPLEVEPGITAAEAVVRSGLPQRCPEIDPWQQPLGVFGRRCTPDTLLRPGDRVEVYRPLVVDPKTARRRRAGQ